jgi:hypothetical protein
MKRNLFVGAFLALSSLFAFAQADDFDALAAGSADAPSDAQAAPAASAGLLKWSGDQEFAWRWGAAENPTRTGGSVDGTVSGEYKLGDLKVVGAALERNGEFVPGETALYFAPGAFKFGVGYQEFSWGLADKKNPTDTLNARDYRYGADAPRLVNLAASAAWYPAEWLSVEGVYEPWKDLSQFPKDFRSNTQAGLDAGRAALVGQGLGALLTGYHPVVTAEGTVQDFANPVYGARANFFLPGLDVSLSYVYDRDTYYTPVVTMSAIGVPGNARYLGSPAMNWYLPGTIDLVLKRIHRLGVNAKTTIDRYGLWVESAYNVTEDPAGTDDGLRNSKLSWTTGFDFNFGPESAYYLNVQYAGEWVLGYDASTLSDYTASPTVAQMADKAYMTRRTLRSMVQSLGSETEEWMHTGTASVKFPLADNLVTPSLSGAVIVPVGYDSTVQTRVASAFLKPEIDWMPADGVHVLFGADLAYGWVKKAGSSDVTLDTTTDKLGVYTPQNNVYVKVQYKWNGSVGN